MVALNMRKIILMAAFCILTACSSNGTAPVDNAWDQVDSTQITHKVQPGETLYSIAWRYNVSDKDLAQWNHLSKPYYVNVGQTLRLTPSSDAISSAAPVAAAPPIESTPSFTPVSSTTPKPKPSTSEAAAKPAAASSVVSKTSTPAVAPASTVTPTGQGSWAWPVKGKVIESYGQNGNKGIDIATPEGSKVKAVQSGDVVYSGSNLHGYGQLLLIRQKGDLMTAYAHNSKLLVKEGDKVSTGQVIALSGDTEASKPMLHFEVRKAGKSVDPMGYLK